MYPMRFYGAYVITDEEFIIFAWIRQTGLWQRHRRREICDEDGENGIVYITTNQ